MATCEYVYSDGKRCISGVYGGDRRITRCHLHWGQEAHYPCANHDVCRGYRTTAHSCWECFHADSAAKQGVSVNAYWARRWSGAPLCRDAESL